MLHLLDLGTRKFWRLTGRPVDLDGAERWLDAPMSGSSRVGAGWVADESARHGGPPAVVEDGAGLLPSMSALDGPGFDASRLRPEVRDFYEHTSAWQMEVWTGWSPLFWPGGEVVSRLWGRRVEQLALPMRPLDVARGMDSRITPIRDAAGTQVAAAWTRTLRADGRPVFSGAYSAGSVPGSPGPSVHVAFPLESGNVQVFLRPTVTDDGGLLLESPSGRFGDDGAYVVVRDGGGTHAARVPLHETFHVFPDDHGVLRTDHELRLWGASAVRLHYRLDRAR
ncbi:hypothetical protein [Nocardioides okcheonensis]|uniref:hypothetical protein n=1 Tax=Nocardioides okcheonensis TaxID=2894081 RepID=UPI001E622724|nr:hypothetical protein [Nocardioides okcheonensis]UFN45918.1 hypothetical protein LN652_06840 [Nocardioides okcheonensis]